MYQTWPTGAYLTYEVALREARQQVSYMTSGAEHVRAGLQKNDWELKVCSYLLLCGGPWLVSNCPSAGAHLGQVGGSCLMEPLLLPNALCPLPHPAAIAAGISDRRKPAFSNHSVVHLATAGEG